MKQNQESKSVEDVAAITSLTLTVFRLQGALLQWGDALVEPLGLTSARWQMLGAMALAGEPMTAPQIGNAMGVTRQGAQKQLNLLLDLGLAVTRANPAHQRSPLYALTPSGARLYKRAEALWQDRAAGLGRAILSTDARSAQATLDTLLSQLLTSSDSAGVS